MDENDSQCDIVDCSPSAAHGVRIGSSEPNDLPQFSTNIPSITDVECDENLGCALSVEEFMGVRVIIYPNPTAHKISITGMEAPLEKIDVFDISGKEVSVKILNENEISLETLANGVYFL